MTSQKRVRRVQLLCCHCVSNIAYYRTGWTHDGFISNEDFWIAANNNFIDIAILEWCKLFADRSGKHHWKKVVLNKDEFLGDLFETIGLSEKQFQVQLKKVKKYRDKFIAHLDHEKRMHIPNLDLLLESTKFLYNVILEKYPDFLTDAPQDLQSFYDERLSHGNKFYPFTT